jgi:TPP-dependent pyruvate/acetoin dehydrogenase alpha subunit
MRDAGYRTREEIEAWKARCPIRGLAARADGLGVTPHELEAIDAEVAAEVADAVEFAKASPWPDPATAAHHVYAGGA